MSKPPSRTKIELLRACQTRIDLARLLGFKPKALAYVLYMKTPSSNYRSFTIPKRNGGVRSIDAPQAELKKLQARLSDLLQDCISDINEGKKMSGSISHGFRRKRSIVTNTKSHRRKRFVLNVDLKDFFPSINFGRVRGFFIKNKNFQLSDEVATTIAQIACYNNGLPQGSPCSPVVSNLIAHILDIRLAKIAQEHKCDYSRYADDLTFSTNERSFPVALAKKKLRSSDEWKAGKKLNQIVVRSGFAVNASKTRLQYRDSRQEVTGLVTNEKTNVRSEYWRDVRAKIDTLMRVGAYYHITHVDDGNGGIEPKKENGSVVQLVGMMSFIHQVKSSEWNRDNPRPKALVGYERSYRDLLFYKSFYANNLPTIICEGKTDSIYLKCAINSLAQKVPTMVKVKSGKIDLAVDFFTYSSTTSRMLDLAGGSGQLSLLIARYEREWAANSAGHKKQPVIMIIDNDAGAKGIYNAVKEKTGKKPTGKEDFIHIVDNLYLVATPLGTNGEDTMIENFFPKTTLAKKLNGKKFNPAKTTDTQKEYGKYVFAEKVVRPNRKTINFSAFETLLKRVESAIADYSTKAP